MAQEPQRRGRIARQVRGIPETEPGDRGKRQDGRGPGNPVQAVPGLGGRTGRESAGSSRAGATLERFRAKWTPVRVKKTRQNKNLEPGSDSIGTEKALVPPHPDCIFDAIRPLFASGAR